MLILGAVYENYKSKIDKSQILKKLGLNQNEYYVLSVHREENIDNSKKLLELKGETKMDRLEKFLNERDIKYEVNHWTNKD